MRLYNLLPAKLKWLTYNSLRYRVKRFFIGDKIYEPLGWTKDQVKIEKMKGQIAWYEMRLKILKETNGRI